MPIATSPRIRISIIAAGLVLIFILAAAAPVRANPDLIAGFEYIHFFEPTLPPALAGLDLINSDQVSDEALLGFLGDNADNPNPACAGDINKDGVVDGEDLAALAEQFGQTNCPVANEAVSFN